VKWRRLGLTKDKLCDRKLVPMQHPCTEEQVRGEGALVR